MSETIMWDLPVHIIWISCHQSRLPQKHPVFFVKVVKLCSKQIHNLRFVKKPRIFIRIGVLMQPPRDKFKLLRISTSSILGYEACSKQQARWITQTQPWHACAVVLPYACPTSTKTLCADPLFLHGRAVVVLDIAVRSPFDRMDLRLGTKHILRLMPYIALRPSSDRPDLRSFSCWFLRAAKVWGRQMMQHTHNRCQLVAESKQLEVRVNHAAHSIDRTKNLGLMSRILIALAQALSP